MSAANSPKTARERKKPGRPFKPGQSGNPRGRPKIDFVLREAARNHTADALKTLVKLMKSEKQPGNVRVAAAREILDRGYGRPEQSVEHSGKGGGPLKWDVKINLV